MERRARSAQLNRRDPEARELYTELITRDVREGRLDRALSVYQKMVLWQPEETAFLAGLTRIISGRQTEDENADDPEAGEAEAASRNALFAGIPADRLDLILASMKPARFGAGEVIVREGDPGDSLFLVTSGSVTVTTLGSSSEPVELARLDAADFFGEVSLLTARPRTATVTALGDVELLELSRPTLQELKEEFPDIEKILSEFHQRRAQKTIEALAARRARA